MGAPPIPSGVPPERLQFVDMRAIPSDDPTMEVEMEVYYTDTGLAVEDPSTKEECPEMSPALDKAYQAPDEDAARRALLEGGWSEGEAQEAAALLFGRIHRGGSKREGVERNEELERLRQEVLGPDRKLV